MNVVVAGAGKIGSLIACMLTDSGDYQVHLIDVQFRGTDTQRLLAIMPDIKHVQLDVKDEVLLSQYFLEHEIEAVISSLPFFLNLHVARAAKAAQIHYFDLTEDTKITKGVKVIAEDAKRAFMPQCGLAPGLVSIIARSLIQEFDVCQQVKLRVGALPQRASQGLHYSLTWSTDGVINEYANLCHGIEHGRSAVYVPLEGVESIMLDGCAYEAFYTSGGLGSLAASCLGTVDTLNYKTIRYPGHRDKMFFLMNELKLNEDRATLKHILEQAIPRTYQDLVVIYVSALGLKNEEYLEKSYLKKIYPIALRGIEWSAIQLSTAAGVCTVVDLVMEEEERYQGFVTPEQFSLKEVLVNRFGQHFA